MKGIVNGWMREWFQTQLNSSFVPCKCTEPQLWLRKRWVNPLQTHRLFLWPHCLSPRVFCWHCDLPGRSGSGLHQVWEPPRCGSPLDAGAAVMAGVRVFVQPCTDRKNTWEWRLHVSCGAHGKTNHPRVAGHVGKVFLSACDGVQRSPSKSGWSCISVCSLSLWVFLSKTFQKYLFKTIFLWNYGPCRLVWNEKMKNKEYLSCGC